MGLKSFQGFVFFFFVMREHNKHNFRVVNLDSVVNSLRQVQLLKFEVKLKM